MNWLKYAAISIAPLVLIWGVWSFVAGNSPPLPGSLMYVDVMSGEVVYLTTGKIKTIPAKNSKGERVLLPAEKREGKIYIVERYKESLADFASDARLKVDPSTLEVKGAR